MHLEDYFDFTNENIIRIRGHRIGLEHVVERYKEGYSPEQIAQEFPGLKLEIIYASITYYLHNQADVDTHLARVRARVEQRMREADAEQPPPVVQRLLELQAQQAAEQPAR